MDRINVLRRRTNRVRPGMRLHVDYWMLLALAGLLVIGTLMVYSTTFDYGFRFQGDVNYYIKRQLTAALLGLGAFIIILQFDYHIFRRFSVIILAGTLLLLIVLLFMGEAIFGATRGLFEGSYQPSEVAKIATILYISHWLSSKGERIKNVTYGLIPFSVITGVVCALIVQQPDVSTAVLIAMISFTLFFVAGADWRQFALAGVIGASVFTMLMLTLPHARGRVDAYTAALQDPSQAQWHVQQSLIALGSGGWFGVGLGRGTQKFGPLPAAHTDGVFAVVGEEIGLLGTLLVIALFGVLVWRGFLAARNARDSYGSLLAIGITCWMAYQALINIAVITAVIPFTGIPLPFLSYGGTSLAISLVGAGILLNVSRDASLGREVRRRRKQSTTARAARPRPTPVATMNLETPRERISVRRRNGRTHLPRSRRRQ